MSPRRSQPEHVGVAASVVAQAAKGAFEAGLALTRAYISKTASAPKTYARGVILEVRTTTRAATHVIEYAADAGVRVKTEMLAIERAQDVGAEVCGWIERPAPREPGKLIREGLVHRRLVLRETGRIEWDEVAPTTVTVDANEGSAP